MKTENLHIYNINESRPKVLFLGNGLFYGDFSWDELIDSYCSDDNKEKWEQNKDSIPYTIRASIACEDNDVVRWNSYSEKLSNLHKTKNIYSADRPFLKSLLALPFDAIITTNYTYQIENHFDPQFCNRSDRYIQKHHSCCTKEKRDSRFLVHTYNSVNGHNVWHIHGEARRKSSIVLTHDEYGRLISELRKELQTDSNRYVECADNLSIKTWMDYFLMGDVYVLGYGADFSEFIFWWMLSRRNREKAQQGQFHFYEAIDLRSGKNNKPKLFALEKFGVSIHDMDCVITDDKRNFDTFYARSIEDIKEKILKER